MKRTMLMVGGLLLAMGVGVWAQTSPATVKLAGSVTLVQKITPKQTAIEAATGQKLELIGNTTVRGLLSVADGSADIGLVGGPWEGVLAEVQAKNPGKVDPAAFKVIPLVPTSIVMITNAASGVKSLTLAQVGALLSGKAANWKDVGGADLAVSVILPPATNGFRIMFQNTIIKGSTYVMGAREIPDLKNIPPVVAQLPGAISFVSTEIRLSPAILTIPTDQGITYPLQLVTLNAASPTVVAVATAVQAALK